MRGSMTFNGEHIRGIHLSVDPDGVHFCRYDALNDAFFDVVYLREFGMSVPNGETLEFSGYSAVDVHFEFLTVEFYPSRAHFIHDSWVEKMAGRLEWSK